MTMKSKVLEMEDNGDITGLAANVVLGHLVKFDLLNEELDIVLLRKIVKNMEEVLRR